MGQQSEICLFLSYWDVPSLGLTLVLSQHHALFSHLGKEKKKKKKLPADFKPSWMLQAEVVGWASLFSLSMVLRGWGPGLGHTLHSCLSSIPVPPFSAGPILPVCTRPAPSIHQLCSPWSAPVRGNSHITFSFFAVLRARHSQSLFRIV